MLRLYHLPQCPYCARVREKLAELGLQYEKVQVPVAREERQEVLRLSGQSSVPVLQDGERVIAGSDRILTYLEETYGR